MVIMLTRKKGKKTRTEPIRIYSKRKRATDNHTYEQEEKKSTRRKWGKKTQTK